MIILRDKFFSGNMIEKIKEKSVIEFLLTL